MRRTERISPFRGLRWTRLCTELVVLLQFACVVPLLAQQTPPDSAGWKIGPPGQLYPSYLADPRRPQTSAGVLHVGHSDLSDEFDSGPVRTIMSLGGRVPVLRFTASGGQAWELSGEGAFFGQFDAGQSLENIGWDGWYGFLFSWRFARTWSSKLSYRHLSSHLGDEFIERTGRERIGYTREDVTLGLAWKPLPGAAAYGEVGFGVHDGAGRQESGYIQFGAQYSESEPVLWKAFGWQIGTDFQLFEEEDYDPDITVQVALLIPLERQGQRFRLALEFHTGRVQIGELSEFDEDYVGLIFGWDF